METSATNVTHSSIDISYPIEYSFDGKYFNVSIPKFDIYFSTTDESMIKTRGRAMIVAFILNS